jgi:hypothetical protein
MDTMRRAVFTDEKRVEQRTKGFANAKKNAKKEALSEFM